ncbi:MAG: recombination-associated protein RdgC [Desulfobacterales bacterium]
MGLLSSTASIVRYRINGKIETSVKETILKSLSKFSINDELEDEVSDKVVGWTSFSNPYHPDFSGMQFDVGSYFIFSLRIDKRNISSKLIQKHVAHASAIRLKDTGRRYLSRDEKRAVREHVVNELRMRIPATPNVYDLLWHHDKGILFFFSTLKSANEELETLFFKTFGFSLIRLFPYTMAELSMNLSDAQKDILLNVSPTTFTD